MRVNTINFSTNCEYKKRNILNSTNEKKQNQLSFSAKKLPSGVYSDWFFNLVSSLKELSKANLEPIIEDHVHNYKVLLRKGFWNRLLTSERDADIAGTIRRNNFLNLHSDLRTNSQVEDLGKKPFDFPEREYSSLHDYENRHPATSKPSDKDDYINRDGGMVGECWDEIKRDS